MGKPPPAPTWIDETPEPEVYIDAHDVVHVLNTSGGTTFHMTSTIPTALGISAKVQRAVRDWARTKSGGEGGAG
jgi:hypothetical protein